MHRGRLTGICVLLIGAAIFAVLIPAGIVIPGNVNQLALSPDFWPRIVAAIIILMGVVMAVRPVQAEVQSEHAFAWKSRFPGLSIIAACLFGFYFLIPFLGMVAGGMVVLLILMRHAGERYSYKLFGIALAIPVILYLFFVKVARIPLPLGWFELLAV